MDYSIAKHKSSNNERIVWKYLLNFKIKINLFESDDEKKLLDKFSTVFSNQNSNKRCNRSTWKGAVFDESFFEKYQKNFLKSLFSGGSMQIGYMKKIQ